MHIPVGKAFLRHKAVAQMPFTGQPAVIAVSGQNIGIRFYSLKIVNAILPQVSTPLSSPVRRGAKDKPGKN